MRSGRRAKILLVDDVAANVEILEGVLADDYTVEKASNGVAALNLLKTSRPDLILLDVRMPGMDGFEVCRRLRDNPATAGIPVIFVTALSAKTDIDTGEKVGGDYYLTKPVHPPKLLQVVKGVLSIPSVRSRDSQQGAIRRTTFV